MFDIDSHLPLGDYLHNSRMSRQTQGDFSRAYAHNPVDSDTHAVGKEYM
jgi:hypothetical protein